MQISNRQYLLCKLEVTGRLIKTLSSEQAFFYSIYSERNYLVELVKLVSDLKLN